MLKEYIKRIVKEELLLSKDINKIANYNIENSKEIADLGYRVLVLEEQNEKLAKLLDSAVVKMDNAYNGYIELEEKLEGLKQNISKVQDFSNQLAILVTEKSPKIKRIIYKDATTKKKVFKKNKCEVGFRRYSTKFKNKELEVKGFSLCE